MFGQLNKIGALALMLGIVGSGSVLAAGTDNDTVNLSATVLPYVDVVVNGGNTKSITIDPANPTASSFQVDGYIYTNAIAVNNGGLTLEIDASPLSRNLGYSPAIAPANTNPTINILFAGTFTNNLGQTTPINIVDGQPVYPSFGTGHQVSYVLTGTPSNVTPATPAGTYTGSINVTASIL